MWKVTFDRNLRENIWNWGIFTIILTIFTLEMNLFSSVTQLCQTLWDTMNHSTPGLMSITISMEFTQTNVHRVSDAIQPSHPLLSPFPPALNLSQHQGLFNESALHIRWPKYCSFSFGISPSNEYSDFISFRIDWFDLLAVQGILKRLETIWKINSIKANKNLKENYRNLKVERVEEEKCKEKNS